MLLLGRVCLVRKLQQFSTKAFDYRRQDEIGTPYCVTVDFQTLDDDTVTIRDRDTTDQKRVKISQLGDI